MEEASYIMRMQDVNLGYLSRPWPLLSNKFESLSLALSTKQNLEPETRLNLQETAKLKVALTRPKDFRPLNRL